MKSRTLTCAIAMPLFVALAAPARLGAQEQQQQGKEPIRYTVTDLGLASDSLGGINHKGWLDYSAILPDGTQHASLLRRGRKIDLGTLGGPSSASAHRPSERGQVVGAAETANKDPLGEDFCGYGTNLICLGFVWQDGLMTPLTTLGGNNSSAADINNRGEIVGSAENNTLDATCLPPSQSPPLCGVSQCLQNLPVFWKNGEIHELPTVFGDPDGAGQAINDHGQIVGASTNCTATPLHAVLWQNDTANDLGSLGGTMFSLAIGINNRGQVVGGSNLAGDTTGHAFLWTEDKGMQDLGTLPGDFSSFAESINDKGQVVGLSFDVNENARAFLWQDGVMTDLNKVIPPSFPFVLVDPFDINTRGEIVGFAVDPNTDEGHAFLAIPCNQEHANRKGCTDKASSSGESRDKPKVSLPENVRQMLRQRLGPLSRIPEPMSGPTR